MNAYSGTLALVTVFLTSWPLLAGATEMPAVGSVAPDFTLPAHDGSKVKLSALRGTGVVLYFYPKFADVKAAVHSREVLAALDALAAAGQ